MCHSCGYFNDMFRLNLCNFVKVRYSAGGELASYLTCWQIKCEVLYQTAVFEVTLHIGETNEGTRFIISADLEVLLPLFSSEMLGITLKNSNHVLQIHKKKPLRAKFEVTVLSLVKNQFIYNVSMVYPLVNYRHEKLLCVISNNEVSEITAFVEQHGLT